MFKIIPNMNMSIIILNHSEKIDKTCFEMILNMTQVILSISKSHPKIPEMWLHKVGYSKLILQFLKSMMRKQGR